jgi:hypothetical protein
MRFKHVPELPPELSGATEAAGEHDGRAAALAAVDPTLVVDYVGRVQSAVPLVPGSEDDCCARLQRRRGYESRDVSRTWLTFLRALGLAAETDEGYRRTRTEPTVERVRAGLLEGVLGAAEIGRRLRSDDATCGDDSEDAAGSVDVDAAGSVDVDDAFAAVEPLVPRWERTRTDDWESVWRERVERLLDWLVALDLAAPIAGEQAGGSDRYRGTKVLSETLGCSDA